LTWHSRIDYRNCKLPVRWKDNRDLSIIILYTVPGLHIRAVQ